MSLIFDGEDLAIYYNKGRSDFLLITFIGIGHEDAWAFGYFGKPLAEKEHISCVGISPKKRNWYVTDEIFILQDLVKKISPEFRKIITIGISAGGYAAIKYSSLLNSDITLAFAPQLSIDANEWETIEEWAVLCTPLMRGMGIKNNDLYGKIVIAYDKKHRLDQKTALKIQSYLSEKSEVFLLNVPYSGHIVYENLKGLDNLSKIIQVLNKEYFDIKELFSLFQYLRRKNYVNLYNKLKQNFQKHPLLCYYALIGSSFKNLKNFYRILNDETFIYRIVSSLSMQGYHKEASHLLLSFSDYNVTKEFNCTNIPYFSTSRNVLIDHRGRILCFSLTLGSFVSSNPVWLENNANKIEITFLLGEHYLTTTYLGMRYFLSIKENNIILSQFKEKTDFIKAYFDNNFVYISFSKKYLTVFSDKDFSWSDHCLSFEKFYIVYY